MKDQFILLTVADDNNTPVVVGISNSTCIIPNERDRVIAFTNGGTIHIQESFDEIKRLIGLAPVIREAGSII
jgi:hypothetical protein